MDMFHSPAFHAHVEDLLKQHHVPGLAVALVQNETVDSVGYGQASLDPPRPCTADTLFDIASSSKSLTAACVALLVDDNETYPGVQWDTPMSTLLPGEFEMPARHYTENVTIDDVLGHRTGMAR
jgi:CubicO group peptidase (beta-lactamase class C family)